MDKYTIIMEILKENKKIEIRQEKNVERYTKME